MKELILAAALAAPAAKSEIPDRNPLDGCRARKMEWASCRDFDATETIWHFFSRQRRRP